MTVVRDLLLARFRWRDGHADFSPLLRDPAFLRDAGDALAEPFRDQGITAVVGLEARGFVLSSLTARALGVGLVLARKPGSIHPGSEIETATEPDWRGRHVDVRIAADAVGVRDRALIVDDWIETGSQARTARRLLARLGAPLVGVSVLVDDASEETRADLGVVGVVRADELPS